MLRFFCGSVRLKDGRLRRVISLGKDWIGVRKGDKTERVFLCDIIDIFPDVVLKKFRCEYRCNETGIILKDIDFDCDGWVAAAVIARERIETKDPGKFKLLRLFLVE